MTIYTGRIRAAVSALVLCALLGAQNSVTVNGIASQRGTAGGVTAASGTTDTGGDVTLVTATGYELYTVTVGGYVTAATGTGGTVGLTVTCAALSAANISSPTGLSVEQLATGGGLLPAATACLLRSGDILSYNFSLTNNVMGTIAGTYRVSVQKLN